MKVTGFSFIRNALIYDYPIKEAIRSILPICDEFIVAVGESEDETEEFIRSIDQEKIKIIRTKWDDSIREKGKVLAIETDKAFQAIGADTDWAFYIQGDEVVHEKYLNNIKDNMLRFKNDPNINGLLFKYIHFYGSYDYMGTGSNWYKNEIRVIKNDKSIYSYKDAQGFRMLDDKKLNVFPINAYVYHYGWVKDPRAMQRKQETFHKYWHDDNWVEKNVIKADEFDYGKDLKELQLFSDTHPKVMTERIKSKNWTFNQDLSIDRRSLKDKAKLFLNKYFGLDFSYKNYKITKTKSQTRTT